MSDLFIGEILILSLLLPVLLRPFFRRLQRIEGIVLLPFFSLLMCVAIIAGIGFRLSFVPVLVFTLLVFFSLLSRSVRLLLGLPTDLYTHWAVVYSCFLLVLYAGALWFAVMYAPESSYQAQKPIRRTVFVQRSADDIKVRFSVLSLVDTQPGISSVQPVVIVTGDGAVGTGSRNTTAWLLAENGYVVVEADASLAHVFRNPLYSVPVIRKACSLVGSIENIPSLLPSVEETETAQALELSLQIEYVRKVYGQSAPLFIVSEGSSSNAAVSRMNRADASLAGLVCIVSENTINGLLLPPGGFTAVSIDTGVMPSNAGAFPVLVLTGSPALLCGDGELGADDVLAAMMRGGQRDVGRKLAELTGRRILTWMELRGKK